MKKKNRRMMIDQRPLHLYEKNIPDQSKKIFKSRKNRFNQAISINKPIFVHFEAGRWPVNKQDRSLFSWFHFEPAKMKQQQTAAEQSRIFLEEPAELMSHMIKRPIPLPYMCLSKPRVMKPPEETDPMITKVQPIEPKMKVPVSDPKRFLLEKIGRIPVTSLRSLVDVVVRQQPDIGYIHMNREHMDLVNDYEPYNYIIAKYTRINKDNYATISRNGVLELYKADADFLPLDRLPDEQKLLNDLREINSFASFRLWKAFMVWFTKNRIKRFVDAKDKLEMFFAAKYDSKEDSQKT
ncbi:uncharacterized protein CEXT_758691 [Caerostris extrusa]|uniref:Uncharacterized protein n=1 Tax=Caerostris extrusa TaxID=172846 RepID=A0AAV4X6Z2_CAEEX|nr:uncharacterized protein CEXT_758691 [Caerostris extrusa]